MCVWVLGIVEYSVCLWLCVSLCVCVSLSLSASVHVCVWLCAECSVGLWLCVPLCWCVLLCLCVSVAYVRVSRVVLVCACSWLCGPSLSSSVCNVCLHSGRFVLRPLSPLLCLRNYSKI